MVKNKIRGRYAHGVFLFWISRYAISKWFGLHGSIDIWFVIENENKASKKTCTKVLGVTNVIECFIYSAFVSIFNEDILYT